VTEYIPVEILRGRIFATKSLVKKQIRAIREIEEEIEGFTSGDLKNAGQDRLKEIAKSLREFHICVENAFVFIAENFDGGVPKAENVHESLMDQMTRRHEKSRPPVIDKALARNLKSYLDFRLDMEKDEETGTDRDRIMSLLENFKTTSAAARQQLLDFFEALGKFHDI